MQSTESQDLTPGVTGDAPTAPDSRWIALYVLCAGMLMIVLDVTVVNVALPTVQEDLGFSDSGLAWVVNAYLIAFGGLLLLSGRLGDLIGRRKLFLYGIVLFTIASGLCGLAQNQAMLIGARFLQGVGGAMASAVILGMIVTMFPAPKEQAKAMGVYAFVASAGGAIGLLAGGVLTDAINWHWIFFINVPVGVATTLLAVRLIEDDEGIGIGEGADAVGAGLITGSLMLGVFTIVNPAAERGWGDPLTLGLAVASGLLLATFIWWESRAPKPLIPLRIFASRALSGANAVQALLVAAMFGMFFMGALYMQKVLDYSPLEVGLAFLPSTLIMASLSIRFAEPLITRFGARRVLLTGIGLVTAAMLLMTRVPVDGSYVADLLPVMIVMGMGIGSCFPALMTIAMSTAEQSDAGLASGLVNTSAQVGGALGLAVLATLAASRSDSLEAQGQLTDVALTSGYHLAFWISVALLVGALLVGYAVLGEPEQPADGAGEPGFAQA